MKVLFLDFRNEEYAHENKRLRREIAMSALSQVMIAFGTRLVHPRSRERPAPSWHLHFRARFDRGPAAIAFLPFPQCRSAIPGQSLRFRYIRIPRLKTGSVLRGAQHRPESEENAGDRLRKCHLLLSQYRHSALKSFRSRYRRASSPS